MKVNFCIKNPAATAIYLLIDTNIFSTPIPPILAGHLRAISSVIDKSTIYKGSKYGGSALPVAAFQLPIKE
jgi:hypothetical protein